jgi:hypothetical protein
MERVALFLLIQVCRHLLSKDKADTINLRLALDEVTKALREDHGTA